MSDRRDWKQTKQATNGGAAPPPGSGPVTTDEPTHEPVKTEGARPRSIPGVGRVALVSTEDGTTLRARLDDGYPLFFGGYGGWEDEARPGQVSATVFRGAAAPQLKLRLILGRWPLRGNREQRSRNWATNCERGMRMIEHFARQPIDAPRQDRPTLLRIRGHVPHHNRRWFVQDVEWGEVDLVGRRRVRAFVTVTLRMYVPVDLLGRRARNTRPTKPYTVKKGERLDQILRDNLDIDGSKHLLHARRIVRHLNGMRPGDPLKERMRIKLPRGSWWRSWRPRPRTERAPARRGTRASARR